MRKKVKAQLYKIRHENRKIIIDIEDIARFRSIFGREV